MTTRKKNARNNLAGVFFSGRQTGLNAGFTLIELLVVLVILALFSSMAVISIGDNFQREMQSEAERLQSIIIGALDESVYTSTELGFYLTEKGYVPLQFNRFDNRWSVLAAKPFLPHVLPEGMRIDWVIEGFSAPGAERDGNRQEFDFNGLLDSENKDNAEQADSWFGKSDNGEQETGEETHLQPQILTLSSGELTVFSITFMAAEDQNSRVSYTLKSDGFSMPIITQANGNDET
jgi:general secretion pathway protein H